VFADAERMKDKLAKRLTLWASQTATGVVEQVEVRANRVPLPAVPSLREPSAWIRCPTACKDSKPWREVMSCLRGQVQRVGPRI